MPGTKLNKTQEKAYQQWRSKLPKALQYEGDYDLRGLYKSNPNAQPSLDLHFPDTYKLPNHPTFSNESIYFNNRNKNKAGYWMETDSSFNYIPFNPAVKDTIVERKMPNGGKLNNMPDNRKRVNPSDYEKARASRLLELSRQWGVPTSEIFSQVKKGPRDAYRLDDSGQRAQNIEYTSYYTFNPQGGIGQSTRDYANPVGQTQFTPEDIQLQQQLPGRGITTSQLQAQQDPNAVTMNKLATMSPGMRYGGLMGTQQHRSPQQTYNMYAQGGQMQFREGSAFEDCTPYYTTNYSNGQLGKGGIPPKVYNNGGQIGHFNEGSMFQQPLQMGPPRVYNFGGSVNHFGPTTRVSNTNRPAKTQDYTTSFAASPFPTNYSTWDSPYSSNSYRNTFEMGGPITYDPTSYLDPNFEPIPIAESGIHINPKNKGKFTAAAKRAGMGVQEYAAKVLANKENYSPTLVKRANFARNAAKWNEYGGQYPQAQYGDGFNNPFNQVSTPENPIYYDPNNTLDINTPLQQNQQQPQRGGGMDFGSLSLGTMGPIMAASALSGQIAGASNRANTSATQRRRQATSGPYYNPYSYGSGATNLYQNGGKINRKLGMTLSDAMSIIRDHGYDIQIED